MSITNYGELKTAVANWLADDSLTDRIPEFIAMAEDRAALELRIRAMETTADLTITAGTREVALPTGYVQMRRLFLSTDPVHKLEYIPPQDFWSKYHSTTTSKPEVFTIEGENIVLGPIPDTGYTGKILHYKRFTALSDDSDTNWLISNARGILLYGALIEAAPFLGDDPRLLTWSAMYDDLVAKVRLSDKRDRHSGSELTVQSAVTKDHLR